MTRLVLLSATVLVLGGCPGDATDGRGNADSIPGGGVPASLPTLRAEVVRMVPHDPGAYTQGLAFHDGALYESTGLEGRSSLRKVDIERGTILRRHDLAPKYFAEGIAILGDRIYQLTWKTGEGFVYDLDTFREVGRFQYFGEGWGLTTDGTSLIMSNGTHRLQFLDPTTFQVTRTLDVASAGAAVSQLNELEWVNGEIYANVWQTDQIARIDPATGQVTAWIDLAGLLSPIDRAPDTDVLNGIAYDSTSQRLWVTGKLWPRLFEIRLRQ